jgi:hypothetical protein
MTKTQQIRDLMKTGFSGTAREIAAATGVSVNTTQITLSKFIKQGLIDAQETGQRAPNGRYIRRYTARPEIHDDSISSHPPAEKYEKDTWISGWDGLAIAVINVAVNDARRGRGETKRRAVEWFESESYKWYMDFLGLNPEMRPVFMREAGR